MLDNLDIYIVCLEGMQTADAEQQRLSGVFFLTMMLLSSVSEEVYFPCHFVELPLIELLSHVLSEGINKIKVCECLWRHA